jgi:hypothetical protein
MKTIRTLSLLVLFAASATIVVGQTGAPASPTEQPTSQAQNTPAAPPSSVKALTVQERQKVESDLDQDYKRYSSKGNWYLAFYYIFVLGAALASAVAGFLLQRATPDKSYKTPAATLAFVGSALVIVTTYINFRTNSIANKVAANETYDLKIEVMEGKRSDMTDIEKEKRLIYRRKQRIEGVIQ